MEVWGDDSDFDSAEIENQYPSSGHTSDEENKEPENIEVKGKGKGNDFFGFDSDSDSDDNRTIRTAQEKRFEEMKKWISKIESSMKIEDWGAIGSDWDGLSKIIQKAKNITDKVGNPKFYLTFLCGLDDMVNGVDKVALKSMKPKKAHYFNSTKKAFKRFLKDTKGLEDDLSKFRTNPESFVDPTEPGTNEKRQKKKQSESFGLSSNEDDDHHDKKGGDGEIDDEDKKNKDESKEDTKTKVPKEDDQPWTQDRINKKLHEMIKERGKKNYVTSQVHEHIKLYRFLLTKVENNIVNQLYIQFRLVNAQLDTNLGTPFLNINTWKRIYNEIVTILDTLFLHPNIILEEETIEEDAKSNPNVVCGHLLFSLEKLHEEFLRSLQNIDPHVPEYVTRLSHETDFLLLLQYAEKYYERQKDFKRISAIALRQLDYLYYKRQTAEGNIEEIKVLKKEEDEDEPEIERPDEPSNEEDSVEAEPTPEIVEQAVDLTPPTKDKVTPYVNLMATVEHLTSLVYRFCDDPLKRRATLQHIYHLALHDKFTHGRDLLFMTHLMEKINKARPPEQVMFNRAIVQLGLAAFREGRIEDASNCLQDILQNNKDKAKELLAQGIVHYPRNQVERNTEQEKQERSRQIPYHMHINLDLVEAVLLVSGMLLEIPNLAQSRFRPDRDTKRKVLTKYFRKSFDFYNERQLFTGPPENTKESIIVAAKGLERGDWVSCRDLIISLDIWRLLPEPVTNVLDTLTRHIQEAALKTYLATYAQYYDTLHVNVLSEMFNLPKSDVHSMVSSLMMRGELHASLDQPSGAIVVHGQDPTTLQAAALAFAEKANTLLDANDPATDSRGAFERRPHVGWTEQRPQRTGGGGQQQRGGRSDGQFNARSFERQFQTRRKVGQRGGGIRSTK